MVGVSHSSSANSADAAMVPDALKRDHTWPICICYACGLSLCITVDILQYSMPLAFLPSVLEDRGHSTMKIASAIGVYYWTGFAGGAVITSYQIWRVLRGDEAGDEGVTTTSTVRRQIKYLIVGLLVGGVTLSCQAAWPHFWTHACCRFIQGAAGSFIFFYTFLLSVSLFQGQQQVFAMTAASTALNIAEVLGSFFGAILYDVWGQSVVFGFLAVVSMLNIGVLIVILWHVKASPALSPNSQIRNPVETGAPVSAKDETTGWQRLKALLASRKLGVAVLMIVASAVVKGSVEEMLPFHADHEWGFGPLQIGRLFSVIAVAYIFAAVLSGKLWSYLHSFRYAFSASWLVALGGSAWLVFAVVTYRKSEYALWAFLAFYGVCLGLTHTPAALLLAEAVEHEERESCKDAVNGIWNTMWEAGGSIGFLLGGLLAHEHDEQMDLLFSYTIMCVIASGGILALADWSSPKGSMTPALKDAIGSASTPALKEKMVGSSYGSTA